MTMNISVETLKKLLLGVSITLLSATPLLADDTEIYIGSNLGVNDVPPNVLFILDTSGSMSATVTTQTPYDPVVDYSTNPGACFSNSRIYTSKTTDCSTNRYFNATALVCEGATTSLTTTGFYQDRMAQWKDHSNWWKREWLSIANAQKNRMVECKADQGKHGNGGTEKYAATKADGPWSSDVADSINWNGTGNSKTIYTGNYLNWYKTASSSTTSRIDIMKDVMRNVVSSVNNINIGLMRYSRNSEGGMVVTPMGPIDTTRADFITALNAMTPAGGTPMAEVQYEAARYFQGKNVDYGNSSTSEFGTLLSHADSRTPSGGSKYKTPIEFQCQKNFVVLLSDGSENSVYLSPSRLSSIGLSGCSGSCLDDIAGSMAGKDQSTTFSDKQVVSTYTIGLAIDHALLKATAQASKNASGAGEYYQADDSAQLTTAFTNILTDILGVSATFSSPAVSVNAFNRTTHRQDLYFTLFKPDVGPHWDGNFKRYKLTFNNFDEPSIVDVNGDAAVSDSTGFFKDDSTSYWTTSDHAPDGSDAHRGGAASKLSATRKVYTNISSGDALTDGNNAVHENNTGFLTEALLGVDTKPDPATYRTNLLRWARGIDVNDDDADGSTTDARVIMGDPLHAQPALIQYGGPDSDPDITAYIVTNDGYLHAIDTRKAYGTEIFSFIPKELLPRLDVIYEDDVNTIKPYGIDGSVVPWVIDKNGNGIIEEAQGDRAYIFFGMRRGGNNYYGLDVTDRSDPKMLWTIEGGSADFVELAQSWAKPILRRVKVNGTAKYVLIFTGGYDTAQDGVGLRSTDSQGRAIYMVDALNGSRIWWAAHNSHTSANIKLSEMAYSIPANVAAIDTTADGLLNVIYAADMGGQIFRFDFPGSEINNASGGRIAELAENTVAGTRRFYYQPDVAIMRNRDRTPQLAVVITSGYRAHPLNLDVDDRIYMIRDKFPVEGITPTYTTITESNLYDATDNLIGQGTAAEQATASIALNNASGWYVRLTIEGEKGLAKPLIFGGNIFATTYLPKTLSGGGASCAPSEGSGLLYLMNLYDAQPAYNFDLSVDSNPDHLTREDRVKVLTKGGIPADPTIIKSNRDVVCVGTECENAPIQDFLKSEYWYEQ